ncbi:MAG: TetR/AcrR family transcriptional regulator C-terminal domain-containing protein [Sphaerochaetaceae bacterium]|nr:TetR/AcrR family transcriptional regulator C-terminal domain-containing protein [Sphaerochaetaceae bacterium]MDC7237275.1 TetR/AcrR family transcriptional regulator C-terminal domain-containing protein [Sphaerochaetaceae bacterium]MDC7250612.1 TetR/AcrR family transcriptional regulator C-terminal domain-containing protein [Sphaerochaetaceae bacterium]
MSLVTKLALGDSLKNLLKLKTLDKITIQEIVDECGLNRQSFYYHFSNIYDLVAFTFAKDVEENLEDKVNYDDWKEGFLVVLDYCRDNSIIMYNLYHSRGKSIIEEGLKNYVTKLLLRVIDLEIEELDITVSNKDKQFIANYNMFAFVGLVMLWIDSNMEEEPKLLIERINILIKGDFKKALYAFSSIN